MTNTNRLTGAVAFLASIAVLDNFLIVEQDPTFDGMIFIDATAVQSITGLEPSDASTTDSFQVSAFWLDRDQVSSDDFSEFVNTMGYEKQREEELAAREYCNWLGKDFPSQAQMQFAAQDRHEQKLNNWGQASSNTGTYVDYHGAGFRCAKNVVLTAN